MKKSEIEQATRKELQAALKKLDEAEYQERLEEIEALESNKKVIKLKQKFDDFSRKIHKELRINVTCKAVISFEVGDKNKIIFNRWESSLDDCLDGAKEVKELVDLYNKEYKELLKETKDLAQSEKLYFDDLVEYVEEELF